MIAVREQFPQLFDAPLFKTFTEQLLHFRDLRCLFRLRGGVREAVNAAGFRALPALAPFGEIHLRVRPEIDIGRLHAAEKSGRLLHDREACSALLHFQRSDRTARARSFETAHKKAVRVIRGQTRAGIMRDAARAIGQEHDGRDDPVWRLRFARLPEVLGHPRITLFSHRMMLPAHAPAVVAAWHEIMPALAVAHVAVVVAGEKIAVIIEGEFLWIAEAVAENFELGTVALAAKHRTFIGQREGFVFLRHDMRAAVAEGKVEPSIRREREAMEIVAGEGKTHAVAAAHDFAFLGFTVFRESAEGPQVWNVRTPDFAIVREHAGIDAIEQRIHPVRIHARFVGLPVAIGVFHTADDFRFDAELLPVGWEILFDRRDAVVRGAASEIVFEHEHVVPDIEGTRAVAIRLGHIHHALFVDRERDGICEQRLRSEKAKRESLRHLHFPRLLFPHVGRGRDFRLGQTLRRFQAGRGSGAGGHFDGTSAREREARRGENVGKARHGRGR